MMGEARLQDTGCQGDGFQDRGFQDPGFQNHSFQKKGFRESDVMKPDAENMTSAGSVKYPEMDEQQFMLWSDLLEEKTGMRLPENRKSFLTTNLGMRMRELGIDNYQEYYDHICSGLDGTVEWDRLVHHLTVHETRFLRHEATSSLICEHVLPQDASHHGNKPLTFNIWSVGCSTGEEPYSIAMAIDDHLEKLGIPYYLGVIASDISRSALTVGRSGIYATHKIRQIEPEWLDRYFTQMPDGKYQVIPELRQRVCFNQLNVLDMGKTPIGNMDAIVCQNLLIYYDRERRKQIADTLVNYLAPGGLLILAVGELLHWSHPDVERFPFANTLAYRRIR
jgi:type IV pilus assembly protein PilK